MWNSAAEQNGSDQGHAAFKPSYLIRCACELTKPFISRFLGTKFFSAFSTSLRRRQQSVKHYVIRRQCPEGFWANETLNFETNLTNLSACEAEGRRQKAEVRKGGTGESTSECFGCTSEREVRRKREGGGGQKGLHILVVGRPNGSLQVQPMSWTGVDTEKLQLSIIVRFTSRRFSTSSPKP